MHSGDCETPRQTNTSANLVLRVIIKLLVNADKLDIEGGLSCHLFPYAFDLPVILYISSIRLHNLDNI